MKSFDYFAVIHPSSKYSGQMEFKPFKVKFEPSTDGYHWKAKNVARYRDEDLILLYSCPNDEWFYPVLNRGFVKASFDSIHISGRTKGEKRKVKPSKLRKGQTVIVSSKYSDPYEAEFIERMPRTQGQSAKNYFIAECFKGINSPDDTGSITMSDYDVSNLCSVVD